MDEEGIMYLAFVLCILLVAVSMAPRFGSKPFAILAALIVALTGGVIIVLNFADYLVVSIGFGLLGITFQPALGYTITKDQKSAVKEASGIYYAVGYLSANLFAFEFKQESSDAETDAKMTEAPLKWELAVSNINFPFKYHVISAGLNVQDVRDEFEGKRSYQEYQLSQVLNASSGKDTAIAELQRKIKILQGKMDRISGGEKPIGSIMYVETAAIGISEKAAVDALERQLSGLQIALSPLNVDLQRVVGRELYRLFGFSFHMPLSYQEMLSYFDKQS